MAFVLSSGKRGTLADENQGRKAKCPDWKSSRDDLRFTYGSKDEPIGTTQ